MVSLSEAEKKLAEAKSDVRHLTVMSLRPNLSPEKRELLRNLERSARAEVKLRLRALEHERQNQ